MLFSELWYMIKDGHQQKFKGGMYMTFNKENLAYRIAFDSNTNQFMAIDSKDEQHIAYGVTIEHAIKNLNAKKASV